MPNFKLQFRPGIVRDTTDYANQGGWWDCDKIRFRNGFPEKIGGWVKYSDNTVKGAVRALHRFSLLSGTSRLAIGTTGKLYIERGGNFQDITPVRTTISSTLNGTATTSGLSTVTITTASSHGASAGDYVTITGLTTFNGITASLVNYTATNQIEFEIQSAPTSTTFVINTGQTASSTGSGGGTLSISFLMQAGSNSSTSSGGWGAGGWGLGPWGIGAVSTPFSTNNLGLWTIDNYGEDIVASYRYGGIYYWDATTPTDRAVALSSLGGASDAPSSCTKIFVSGTDRHVVAVGVNPQGSSTLDPMLIRWSNQEDPANWTPSTTTSAGEMRLDSGTKIVTSAKTRQENIIFTDNAIYAMQYIGGTFTFGINKIAEGNQVMGLNSVVSQSDSVYWMAKDGFYVYSGQVQEIDCPIKRYILDDMNFDEADKIYCSTNIRYNEIIWHYPSANSNEPDRYVCYDHGAGIWYYGTMGRTCWLDDATLANPLGARYSSDTNTSRLYSHDFGMNDGTTAPETAIESYILSSPIEIGDGDSYGFVNKVIHDVSFMGSTAENPAVTMTFYTKRYPGLAYNDNESQNAIRSSGSTLTVEKFTPYHKIRLRGRQISVKISSSGTDTSWRLGVPRINVQADGKKS